MFFAARAKNLMLDAMDESVSTGMKYASLHTAYSNTGGSEVTGGSPAYARQALTWGAASSGNKAITASMTFNVPATTVAWMGFWDASSGGNFLGITPASGGQLRPCSVETSGDITNNDIWLLAHGLIAGSRIVFWGVLPSGISVGTIYFVISTGITTDSFRVSTTSGGSAVNIFGTQPFNFFMQPCTPTTFGSQNTYVVATGSLNFSLVA